MKGVELYRRVRYAVQIEGLSNREAARRFGIDKLDLAGGFRRSNAIRMLPHDRGVARLDDEGKIQTGHRYCDAQLTMFGKPSRTVWVVGKIWRASDGLLYAELMQEEDRGRRKTISTAALEDPKLYRPVAGEPRDGVSISPNEG